MTRPKSVAIALLGGAVLVGALLGFTADRIVLREQLCEERWEQGRLRNRLADELSLTDEQRLAVDGALDRRNERMRAIMEPVRPQLDSAVEHTRDEIRQLLTPAQRAQFERLLDDGDDRDRKQTESRKSESTR